MPTTSSAIAPTEPVGALVCAHPALARVFESLGIDYCCGGRRTLADACREAGRALPAVQAALEDALACPSDDAAACHPSTLTLTALADHIEATHHAYLRSELPRLAVLTQKVAMVHGPHDARLAQVAATFSELSEEMTSHMLKEERILFPMVRALEASTTVPAFHCGSLANPIRQMEAEHDFVGGALATLRQLTDGFRAPDWACPTYRTMLDALQQLERDTHQHVHKENNILFPRAIALESARRGT